MRSNANLLLVTALLVLPATLAPGAIAEPRGTECHASSSGWNQETASCDDDPACVEGDTLVVDAQVDDDGWVNAYYQCGNSAASCESHDGTCHDEGGPAQLASGGECSAQGDGGTWTRVDVWCESRRADANHWVARIMAAFSGNAAPPRVAGHIHIEGGVGSGEVCAGNICVPTMPVCVVESDSWSCSLVVKTPG